MSSITNIQNFNTFPVFDPSMIRKEKITKALQSDRLKGFENPNIHSTSDGEKPILVENEQLFSGDLYHLEIIFLAQISDPSLQYDVGELLTKIFIDAYNDENPINTGELMDLVEAFIEQGPSKRKNFINTLASEHLDHKGWIKCLPLVVKHSTYLTKVHLGSWQTIIDKIPPQNLVQELSKRKIDINLRDVKGETILTAACKNSNTPLIVEELLKSGEIDVNLENKMGNCPLGLACVHENLEATTLLLQHPHIDLKGKYGQRLALEEALDFYADQPEFLEEFLKHPHLDINLLFAYFEAEPSQLLSSSVEKILTLFPEKTNEWFEKYPPAAIVFLYTSGKNKEAIDILIKQLNSNPSFDILPLLNRNNEFKNFLVENALKQIQLWLIVNGNLDKMSLDNQRLVLTYFFPQFYEYMNYNGILAHKGIELIIDYLRNKKSLPSDPCISVCKDRNTFTEILEKLVQNPNIENGYTHSFIVAKADKNEYGLSAHVTPLFFIKQPEGWQIVITDSTTDNTNIFEEKSSCQPLMQKIKDVEEKFPDQFKVKVVNINVFWRQRDDHSCPIYALRDLVYFHRQGQEFLNKLTQDNITHKKFYFFTDLPPELMKTTQSIKDIEIYDLRFSEKLKMATKKNPLGEETLLENLERHKRRAIGEDKDRNFLMEDRAIKYQKIVIKTLSEKLFKELTME